MDSTQIASLAQALLDPADPIGSLLAKGMSFKRVTATESSSVSLSGVEVAGSAKHFIRHVWSLPKPPAVQGSFVREGFKHKLVKVFKKEIQVGDPSFDDVVYVSTDTPEPTTAFLGCPGVKEAISDIVGGGGSLVIDGSKVTVEIRDDIDPDVEPDPHTEAVLVTHLVATGG